MTLAERLTIWATYGAAVIGASAALAGGFISNDDPPADCVARDVRIVQLVKEFPAAADVLQTQHDGLDEDCKSAADFAKKVQEEFEQQQQRERKRHRTPRR